MPRCLVTAAPPQESRRSVVIDGSRCLHRGSVGRADRKADVMTTSIPQPRTPFTQAKQRVALRLHLSEPTEGSTTDGWWWPQSRDLAIELADLIDHFPEHLGDVHRVVFSRPDWDTAPHRVRVARGLVKVGSYPRDDSHQVWLSMSTEKLIRLSVQDPEGHVGPRHVHDLRGPRAPAPTDAGTRRSCTPNRTARPRRSTGPTRAARGGRHIGSPRPTDPRTSSWLTC